MVYQQGLAFLRKAVADALNSMNGFHTRGRTRGLGRLQAFSRCGWSSCLPVPCSPKAWCQLAWQDTPCLQYRALMFHISETVCFRQPKISFLCTLDKISSAPGGLGKARKRQESCFKCRKRRKPGELPVRVSWSIETSWSSTPFSIRVKVSLWARHPLLGLRAQRPWCTLICGYHMLASPSSATLLMSSRAASLCTLHTTRSDVAGFVPLFPSIPHFRYAIIPLALRSSWMEKRVNDTIRRCAGL